MRLVVGLLAMDLNGMMRLKLNYRKNILKDVCEKCLRDIAWKFSEKMLKQNMVGLIIYSLPCRTRDGNNPYFTAVFDFLIYFVILNMNL